MMTLTLRKALMLVVAGVVGCAALPNAGDDLCANKTLATADGGCGFIQGDAGTIDGFSTPDGGSGDAANPTLLARSSLCGASPVCTPDDPQTCEGDAGDASTESCRMVLGTNQTTEATCVAAGQGDDGASCTSGADCAPGYECVGTGTCRHYCCADESCTTLTQNSSTYDTYFCDIAQEHASSGAKVPVCMVVQHCSPLNPNQCGSGSTCTIVEINSGTNFVATCDTLGTAKLGESCETTHCAEGFACIGAIGQRSCQQLCNSTHPCGSNSTCNMKSQALMQYNVGICG